MELTNRVALITGGARIGHTTACALATAGADLALVYRQSRNAAEATAEQVDALGRRALLMQADLNDSTQISSIIPAVEKTFGRLDVLLNMASLYQKTPLETLTPDSLETNLSADLKSAWQLSLEAAPLMRKSPGGRIINFTDWLITSGRPRYKEYLPYYTAKSAVQGFTEGLALELAPDILVNAIAPGPILPPPDLSEEDYQAVVDATPLNKWGGAESIASTVRFLCENDFITGECIRVDGGRHLA
jgi:NAD(P)-dependent dehydrogenase (short-subunit alcohol dehydrogenase family)